MTSPEPVPEHVVLLREAAQALKDVGKAAIVVKPTLTTPYPDAPHVSPWTRFMEMPARDAYNLGVKIRTLVGPAPTGPPDDPWGTPPTGWRAAPDCDRCKDTGRYQEPMGIIAGPAQIGPCRCKRGRRMSELWFAEKHGFDHPDLPDPEPPEEWSP